jgi:CRP/FNR family cyclic AMP-dependent transcriptional regulator
MKQLFEFIFDKPDMKKLSGTLHQSILFRELSGRELDKVLARAQLRSFTKGQHIFFEDDTGSALYIIVKGNVQIVRHVKGKHVLLATLSKGAFFGEISLVYDLPRSAAAVATDETLLVCLFKHDFEALIKHYPRLGNKLLATISRILAERLSNTLQTVAKQ